MYDVFWKTPLFSKCYNRLYLSAFKKLQDRVMRMISGSMWWGRQLSEERSAPHLRVWCQEGKKKYVRKLLWARKLGIFSPMTLKIHWGMIKTCPEFLTCGFQHVAFLALQEPCGSASDIVWDVFIQWSIESMSKWLFDRVFWLLFNRRRAGWNPICSLIVIKDPLEVIQQKAMT